MLIGLKSPVDPRAPRAADSSAGNRYGPILPCCCCWQAGLEASRLHLSRAQAQENCSHLNKHHQLLPAVALPQQRVHPFPQPELLVGLAGQKDWSLSSGCFQGMLCCSSSLQLPCRGWNGVSVDTLSTPLLPSDTGKDSVVGLLFPKAGRMAGGLK